MPPPGLFKGPDGGVPQIRAMGYTILHEQIRNNPETYPYSSQEKERSEHRILNTGNPGRRLLSLTLAGNRSEVNNVRGYPVPKGGGSNRKVH